MVTLSLHLEQEHAVYGMSQKFRPVLQATSASV
jgi:hypothetical protein